MPSYQIIFHRLAAQEYRSAKQWYRQRSIEVASRFALAVDQSINRITADANSLPVLTGSYRYSRVHRFPYVLIFRFVDSKVVMVMAVAHTSRRPGYWKRRT
jgi:plasmid stabilization system protein ParE